MAKLPGSNRRPQTCREEIANSVSSGVGLLAVMAGIPSLVGSAVQRRDQFSLAGTIILMLGVLTVIGTLLSDLLLMWLDPRIRLEG